MFCNVKTRGHRAKCDPVNVIEPNWPAPPHILAFSTTRQGGGSTGAYRDLNIAQHVGDNVDTVARNRQALARELPAGTAIQWLIQEHGSNVVQASNSVRDVVADASWAAIPAVACAVMTADCLPVLFCSENGEKVAAAHAGWRGLAQGVLENCVAAMKTDTSGILAWLGPAIGPQSFEVGGEVREQFMASSAQQQKAAILGCFKALSNRPGFYLADLYSLARIRLTSMGLSGIYGGGYCTYTENSQFFSYRRDGETGRMVTLITKTS